MTKNDNFLQPLLNTIKSLRGEKGCPWDKKQTSLSLIQHLQSESAELIEAVEREDKDNICEELGDLLYLIIMYAEIHNSIREFDLRDVVENINRKLIRRHPHVFEGKPYKDEEELKKQWQTIKQQEKNSV